MSSSPYNYWLGGSGRLGDSTKWAFGLQGPGYKAIQSGYIISHAIEGDGFDLIMQGSSPDAAHLSIYDGSIGNIEVNAGHYTFVQPAYGAINIGGVGKIGGVTLGHAGSSTPDFLSLSIAPNCRGDVTGSIGVTDGSVFTETGGDGAGFGVHGGFTTSGGATIKLTGGAVGGNITDNTANLTDTTGTHGAGSTVEIGAQYWGNVALNAGTLQLDTPMSFHGTITNLNATPAADTGPLSGLGNGSILLEATNINAAYMTNTGLGLAKNGVTVADLHFADLSHGTGHAALFLTAEPGGAIAVTAYPRPYSFALQT